jgi:aryl-alcohol dehydrogenase-like predicted oxidoreductase
MHFPDPDTPLEQTLVVYDDLVRQGKLRYVALSNHPAWQATQALWIAEDRHLAAAPVCAQVRYNLIDRAAEDELVPACQSSDCPSCRSARARRAAGRHAGRGTRVLR